MSQLSNFLKKHSGELHSIGDIFMSVLSALPLDPADKTAAIAAVTELHDAADRIHAAAADVKNVSISAAEIKAAAAPLIDAAVTAAVTKAVAAALSKLDKK